MIITLLAVIALLFAGYVALITVLVLRIRRFYSDLVDFVTGPGENESQLSTLYGFLIKRLATELKVTIMGSMGGQAKGEAYAEQAVMQDMVAAENPMAGAILSAFPSLGKTFRKNPALLNYALSKLTGMTKPAAAAVPNNGGGFAERSGRYG